MAEKNVFVCACIELFTRLWVRLESLATDDHWHSTPADSAFDRRAELFRLELIVLLDACRTTRWRMLLDGAQRHALERCLSEILDCLNTRFEEAPLPAIERAQNRLLDAVLEQARVLPRGSVGHRLQRARA